MADNFPGYPDDMYEYQNRFNYAVWTPDTVIELCQVPWDSSYRDIVRFDSESERQGWFAKQLAEGYAHRIAGCVYLRYNQPIRVNVPFDQASKYNYIVVSNPKQPVPGAESSQRFYYFINDVQYIAPNTTELSVQLDVWQTYYPRLQFNMCYITRGHIGIANINSTIDRMTKYLIEPEGLNIGDEYEIVHQEYFNFTGTQVPWVLFMCSADLQSDWGTISNPNLTTANGTTGGGVIQGCELYACEYTQFLNLMHDLANAPWVSQCISYITIIPREFINPKSNPIQVKNAQVYELSANPRTNKGYFVVDFYKSFDFPYRYRNLLKFYTSPYTVVEITYNNGGEIILKPECVTLSDVASQKTDFVLQTSVVPPDVRGVFFPKHYNASYDDPEDDLNFTSHNSAGVELNQTWYMGEGLDMALTITNFPQVSIVNNMYAYYLASTVHSMDYSFRAADWSQQKAMMASNLAYNQASMGLNTDWENLMRQNELSRQMVAMGSTRNWNTFAVGTAGNVAGNLVSANVAGLASNAVGAAAGALNTAIENNYNLMATTAQIHAGTDVLANTQQQQAYTMDTNRGYAQYAAKGDYETAILGLQAKVQDARLTQPTTAGQNGGDMFNAANGYFGILIKWKRLKPNYMRTVGDFWLRYGYNINRWITPPDDLKCMENFTYWKMQEVSLGGAQVPELFKETVRGIFEKGVTVWSDPDKMYKISLSDNDPVGGIFY